MKKILYSAEGLWDNSFDNSLPVTLNKLRQEYETNEFDIIIKNSLHTNHLKDDIYVEIL